MASILLTGGAGYVGSVCCAELLSLGHRVLVIDNLSTGFRDAVPDGAEFQQLDIGNRVGMAELLKNRHIDAVFHFAAKALIPESVANPGIFFDENVASGIAMLEVLRAAGINHFIFSSSAATYGQPTVIPIDEEHQKNPVNSYGETKLMLEQVLRWYASSYGWTVVAFRYFNAAGASGRCGERHTPETHIIPLLLEVAAGERSYFQIYGDDYDTPDGSCVRDYVHVVDIAQAHICALENATPGVFEAYNIGSGTGFSVHEVVRAVERVTGRTLKTRIGHRRPGDPPSLVASRHKLISQLAWKPCFASLDEIIQSAWQWKQQLSIV